MAKNLRSNLRMAGWSFMRIKTITVLRVSVFEGKGTYFGDGIDYYYYVDGEGRVICLSRVKASWYEDEQSIGFQPKGFGGEDCALRGLRNTGLFNTRCARPAAPELEGLNAL